MLYGVDVHGGYQAGLDWPTLKRQGYSFAAVKASQGTSFVGPQFASWIKAGRAAGLIMGAYHWIEHGNVAGQVDHFLRVLASVGGPDGLLIQLDCEATATWEDLQEWDRLWAERTGGQPYLIYTGAWWWAAAGRGWPGSTLTPYLWHSHYLAADTDGIPDDPAQFAARIPASWWAPGYGGWRAATILQFTSKGDAGGLRNNVDLNATRLTREQLLALTHAPLEATVTDVALTPIQAQQLAAVDARLRPLVTGSTAPYSVSWTDDKTDTEASWLVRTVTQIAADVAEIKTAVGTSPAGDAVSNAELAAAYRAAADKLDPPAA